MSNETDTKIIGYRDLSPDEKASMNAAKVAFNEVGNILEKLSRIPGYDQSAVSIAKMEAQTAAMWAVRAITKPTTFG